jgi:hypothetical protein
MAAAHHNDPASAQPRPKRLKQWAATPALLRQGSSTLAERSFSDKWGMTRMKGLGLHLWTP